ncbi:cysteine-rich motor neuron 1 protein-like [Styela clava]
MEYIVMICMLLLASTVHAHSCLPCDKEKCRIPSNCPGGLVEDACRCCRVCAKQVNETCGGLYGTHGRCDAGLQCVIRPQHGMEINGQETGVCKSSSSVTSTESCKEVEFTGCNIVDDQCRCPTVRACSNPFQFKNKLRCTMRLLEIEKSRKDCTNAACVVRYSPDCPDDSELIDSVWPAGECCPLPSTCSCRKNKCKQILCRRGFERILVKKATGVPGQCCDQYQCKPQRDQCIDVMCLPVDRNVTCPSDSVMITDRMSKDGCCKLPNKCHCKSSVCPEIKCHDGYRPIINVRGDGRPGTCCDVIDCVKATPEGACSVNGSIYKHGEEFRPEPCRMCQCSKGVYHCSIEQCAELPCQKQYVPEGKCCPKCRITMQEPITTVKPIRICTDDSGKTHLPGEVWFQDPCTRCVCKSNGPKCIASSCQKNCENPRPVEGECCGTCDEPTYMTIPSSKSCPSMNDCKLTGVECPFGFKSDDFGCRICQCREKSEVCQPMSACKLDCQRGFVENEIGCEICQCKRARTCRNITSCDKQCPFGFRKDRSGCSKCRCRRCMDVVATCDKQCKHGRTMNKYGCEICKCRSNPESQISSESLRSKSCTDEDKKRDDGESWTANGRQCVCRRGIVLCDAMECPVPHCDHPVIKDGFVCAVCPGSTPTVGDRLKCGNRVEGESWDVDSCTSCVCNAGRIMCTYQQCQPVPCTNPVYEDSHCCPTCPEPANMPLTGSTCKSEDGTTHTHGATWRPDKCTSCVCGDGDIKCFGDKCPQVHNCMNPVIKRDQCCPQCLDDINMHSCQVGDRRFSHSEVWAMATDSCASCTCGHGNVMCRREICRPVPDSCTKVIRKPGECCDVCGSYGISDLGTIESQEDQTPIFIGVGAGIGVVFIIVIIVLFILFKRKTKGPKVPYQQGHIVRRQPAVNT